MPKLWHVQGPTMKAEFNYVRCNGQRQVQGINLDRNYLTAFKGCRIVDTKNGSVIDTLPFGDVRLMHNDSLFVLTTRASILVVNAYNGEIVDSVRAQSLYVSFMSQDDNLLGYYQQGILTIYDRTARRVIARHTTLAEQCFAVPNTDDVYAVMIRRPPHGKPDTIGTVFSLYDTSNVYQPLTYPDASIAEAINGIRPVSSDIFHYDNRYFRKNQSVVKELPYYDLVNVAPYFAGVFYDENGVLVFSILDTNLNVVGTITSPPGAFWAYGIYRLDTATICIYTTDTTYMYNTATRSFRTRANRVVHPFLAYTMQAGGYVVEDYHIYDVVHDSLITIYPLYTNGLGVMRADAHGARFTTSTPSGTWIVDVGSGTPQTRHTRWDFPGTSTRSYFASRDEWANADDDGFLYTQRTFDTARTYIPMSVSRHTEGVNNDFVRSPDGRSMLVSHKGIIQEVDTNDRVLHTFPRMGYSARAPGMQFVNADTIVTLQLGQDSTWTIQYLSHNPSDTLRRFSLAIPKYPSVPYGEDISYSYNAAHDVHLVGIRDGEMKDYYVVHGQTLVSSVRAQAMSMITIHPKQPLALLYGTDDGASYIDLHSGLVRTVPLAQNTQPACIMRWNDDGTKLVGIHITPQYNRYWGRDIQVYQYGIDSLDAQLLVSYGPGSIMTANFTDSGDSIIVIEKSSDDVTRYYIVAYRRGVGLDTPYQTSTGLCDVEYEDDKLPKVDRHGHIFHSLSNRGYMFVNGQCSKRILSTPSTHKDIHYLDPEGTMLGIFNDGYASTFVYDMQRHLGMARFSGEYVTYAHRYSPIALASEVYDGVPTDCSQWFQMNDALHITNECGNTGNCPQYDMRRMSVRHQLPLFHFTSAIACTYDRQIVLMRGVGPTDTTVLLPSVSQIARLAISPEERYLAIADNIRLVLYDIAQRRTIAEVPFPNTIQNVRWSDDENTLLVWHSLDTLAAYDISRLLGTTVSVTQVPAALSFTADYIDDELVLRIGGTLSGQVSIHTLHGELVATGTLDVNTPELRLRLDGAAQPLYVVFHNGTDISTKMVMMAPEH